MDLLDRRSGLAAACIGELERVLLGSLVEQMRRCGKAACRCATDRPHGPYTYLSQRRGGPGMRYVPTTMVGPVKSFLERGEQVEAVLTEISAINVELLARRQLGLMAGYACGCRPVTRCCARSTRPSRPGRSGGRCSSAGRRRQARGRSVRRARAGSHRHVFPRYRGVSIEDVPLRIACWRFTAVWIAVVFTTSNICVPKPATANTAPTTYTRTCQPSMRQAKPKLPIPARAIRSRRSEVTWARAVSASPSSPRQEAGGGMHPARRVAAVDRTNPAATITALPNTYYWSHLPQFMLLPEPRLDIVRRSRRVN